MKKNYIEIKKTDLLQKNRVFFSICRDMLGLEGEYISKNMRKIISFLGYGIVNKSFKIIADFDNRLLTVETYREVMDMGEPIIETTTNRFIIETIFYGEDYDVVGIELIKEEEYKRGEEVLRDLEGTGS